MVIGTGGNDPAVRQHDFRRDNIVERKPEAPDQRSIAAAEREPRHADAAGRARYSRKPKRICYRGDVTRAGTTRNACGAMVGADDNVSHVSEVDDDPIA